VRERERERERERVSNKSQDVHHGGYSYEMRRLSANSYIDNNP
jgi:hypothetical protein